MKLTKVVNKAMPKMITTSDPAICADFCAYMDGVTFGIKSNHSFSLSDETQWKPTDRVKWADANAMYLEQVVTNLRKYGRQVAEENGLSL